MSFVMYPLAEKIVFLLVNLIFLIVFIKPLIIEIQSISSQDPYVSNYNSLLIYWLYHYGQRLNNNASINACLRFNYLSRILFILTHLQSYLHSKDVKGGCEHYCLKDGQR